MFLQCNERFKNGKDHRHWNIVENKRPSSGCIVQRQVLYLGEISDNQQDTWRKTIEVFDEQEQPKQMLLYSEDTPSHNKVENTIVKSRNN